MIGSLNLGYQLIYLNLTFYGTGVRLVTSTSGRFVIFKMKLTQHSVVITKRLGFNHLISKAHEWNNYLIQLHFMYKPERESLGKEWERNHSRPPGFSFKNKRGRSSQFLKENPLETRLEKEHKNQFRIFPFNNHFNYYSLDERKKTLCEDVT